MKRLLGIALMSLLGAAAGSVIRQKLVHDRSEIVVAASPLPIGAGVVAGALSPKGKPIVAFVVAMNVASNLDSSMPSLSPD